jgi:recombination protein RecA
MYNEGISVSGSILDVATDLGIVKKSGAWFNLGEERLGQGRENAKTYLSHNPEILDSLKRQILAQSPEVAGRMSVGGVEDGVIAEDAKSAASSIDEENLPLPLLGAAD